jgi:hypothetical protein
VIDKNDINSTSFHDSNPGDYIIEANRYGWIWRVRAYVGGVWTDWSEERSFNVEPPTDCSVVLNFDFGPSGEPVLPGTVINNLYAPWGITFEKLGPGTACGTGPQVYANDYIPFPSPLQGNVITTCPEGIATDIAENYHGRIEARFAADASQVCILVVPPNSSGYAFLEAFDANGVVLGRVTSPPGETVTLCISGTGIRGVRFSGEGTHYAMFDNMTVYFSFL